MASSTPELNYTRAKELGKYSDLTESSNGRPHEKSRALAADDLDMIRMCSGCGKHMAVVKKNLVCSCKMAIHCSKDCFKSSKHKCGDISAFLTQPKPNQIVTMEAYKIYITNRKANKNPSSSKVMRMYPSSSKVMRMYQVTKGNPVRIMKYGNAKNPTAAFIIGTAYMERNFNRQDGFANPREYENKSVAETNEIAVTWLKVAAEGGVPEAMFCLALVLNRCRCNRESLYWLDKAYATGTMDYLFPILTIPFWKNFASEFDLQLKHFSEDGTVLVGPFLAQLLMATRFRELLAWDGKTAVGETFYGFPIFKAVMELVGELKNEQPGPSLIAGEKKTILVISARMGYSDFIAKYNSQEREENNVKFLQGVKEEIIPDYQLVAQSSIIDGRTDYLIACKHNQDIYKEAKLVKITKIGAIGTEFNKNYVEESKKYKIAGTCKPCVEEAKQRLRAVSLGLFSMSFHPMFAGQLYAARYANENGDIVQDVFDGYSKPYMRQLLQCLMTNPADLHPLAVAEDGNLFWPIIWFWGSVYKTTLDAIYQSLGDNITLSRVEILLVWRLSLKLGPGSGGSPAETRTALESITSLSSTCAQVARSGVTATRPVRGKTETSTSISARLPKSKRSEEAIIHCRKLLVVYI